MAKLRAGISLSATSEKRFKKVLDRLEKSGEVDIPKIINTEAKKTVDRMVSRAPEDTGRLKRNIHFIQTDKDRVEFQSEAIDPKSKIDYAPLQEFGVGVPRREYFWNPIRRFRRNVRTKFSEILFKVTK